MSHFTVGVICKELNEVEKLLEPYYEYDGEESFPKEYLKFNSITEEKRNKYENDKTEMFVTSDGKYLYPWDSCFDVEITKDEYETLKANGERGLSTKCNFGGIKKYYKTDYSVLNGELREVAYKEMYSTFEEFMKEYEKTELDKEMNDYGYWENPNAKWDWYLVGGRWRNCIPLKNGSQCNYAKLKDINFGIDKKSYDKEIRFWEIVVEDQPLKKGEKKPFNLYRKEYYTERYKNKEHYATEQSKFKTFALLTCDGKWYEKGEMLCFGFEISTEETLKDYFELFDEFVNKEEYQDYYFVVVDCHI